MLGMNRSSLALAVVAAGLMSVIAVQDHRIRTLEQHSGKLALRNDSAAAAADTTRQVALENPKVAALLGDSLHLVQKRVIQVSMRNDSLDKALGLEKIARQDLAVRLESLQQVVAAGAATVQDSATGDRRASFNVRQAPYTLVANVELPSPPDTGKLDVHVSLDPIPLSARLSCAPPNADGIRSASIEASSPAWASVNFTNVQQSEDLCRSPALAVQPGYHLHPALVVGGGVIAPSTRRVQLGGFAGVALAFSK